MLIFTLGGLAGCVEYEKNYDWKEGDFSIEIVSINKTEASVGDEIKVTTMFKNLSGKNLKVQLRGKRELFTKKNSYFAKSFLLYCEPPIEPMGHLFEPLFSINLKKDAVFTMTYNLMIRERYENEIGDLYAFAYTYFYINSSSVFLYSNEIKINILGNK